MALTAPRRQRRKRGPLNRNQLRHALAIADDAALAQLRDDSAEQLARSQLVDDEIGQEIERRHWPGQMTASAA